MLYDSELARRLQPVFDAFMLHALEVRWSPGDVPYDRIERSRLRVDDLFAVFVTLHIENYSDVYVKLLHEVYVDVPLLREFAANWEREEENHARALERYLVALGMPLQELRESYAQVDKSDFPVPSRDPAGLNVFVFLQELFTRESYARIMRAVDEPVLRELLRRVIRDEERHFRFYQQALALRLELDRQGTLREIQKMFRAFAMPQTMASQRAMTAELASRYALSPAEILAVGKPMARLIGARRFFAYSATSPYVWGHLRLACLRRLGLDAASRSRERARIAPVRDRLSALLAS